MLIDPLNYREIHISKTAPKNLKNGLIWREINNIENFVNDWEYVSSLGLWLSLNTLYHFPTMQNNAVSYHLSFRGQRIYLMSWNGSIWQNVVNNSTNYCQCSLHSQSNIATQWTIISTVDSKMCISTNINYPFDNIINQIIPATNYTINLFRSLIVGTPGATSVYSRLSYRLIRG